MAVQYIVFQSKFWFTGSGSRIRIPVPDQDPEGPWIFEYYSDPEHRFKPNQFKGAKESLLLPPPPEDIIHNLYMYSDVHCTVELIKRYRRHIAIFSIIRLYSVMAHVINPWIFQHNKYIYSWISKDVKNQGSQNFVLMGQKASVIMYRIVGNSTGGYEGAVLHIFPEGCLPPHLPNWTPTEEIYSTHPPLTPPPHLPQTDLVNCRF